MNRIILMLLVMVATPAGAAGLEGEWAQVRSFGCGAGTEGGLSVSRDGFVLQETHCAFAGRAPAGFTSASGKMNCLVEGTQAVEAEARLGLDHGMATLSFDGAEPMRFERCGG